MPSLSVVSRKLTLKRKPSKFDTSSIKESTPAVPSFSVNRQPATDVASLLPPASFDVATAAGAAAMRRTLKSRPSQQRLPSAVASPALTAASSSTVSLNSSEDSNSTITPGVNSAAVQAAGGVSSKAASTIRGGQSDSSSTRRCSVASSTYSMVTDLSALLLTPAAMGKTGYEAGLFAVDLENADEDDATAKEQPEWVADELQLLSQRGLLCFSADDYLAALRD